MLTRFNGSLHESSYAADESNLDPRGSRRFENGFAAWTGNVDVHEADGEACLAVGHPYFVDAEHAEIARAQGPAAAWSAAIRKHGTRAPARVRGRFAAVLIRPAERSAMLVADRFGTWPIYYSAGPTEVRFASRPGDVVGRSPKLSAQALHAYLFFHFVPSPLSVFEGASRLEAGHALAWRPGKSELVRYWQPVFVEENGRSLDERRREFLGIVEASVAREAAPPNVGAFLSGGTDSSTVAGMLGKVTGEPPKTYSIGFDAAGYDEMQYARIAARHFGSDHHEYYVTPRDLLEAVPKVAAGYDEPFGNSSAAPALVCAERAKADGIEKLLAGDGGDELFGGNVRYAKQRVFDLYQAVPEAVRGWAIEPLLTDRLPLVRKAASYVSQARVPMPDRLETYNLLLRIGQERVLEPDFLAAVDVSLPLELQREHWRAARAESLINRMLAFDWKFTLEDNDLPKVVGTTKLAGVDVAFPLLDEELIDFSLSLPSSWKLKGLQLRWFFKDALKDFLPPEIIRKKKHGFGLPFGVWLRDDPALMSMASNALESLAARGVVRPAFVRELLTERLSEHSGYYGEMIWITMILELWLQHHAPEWKL